MNLLLDIGNTLQKIAVFHNDNEVYGQSFPFVTKEILQTVFNQYAIKYSIVSSVAKTDAQVIEYLKTNTTMIQYTHQTKLPVTILYKNTESLGLDRIANAVGANTLFPDQNVLSIQAGTCLVFDFVNERKEYLGGSISPGMNMRFEALHEKTKNLPLIKANENYANFLETDTFGSLSSGVLNGICYEIDGFIESYKIEFENLKVILTGGDAPYLQKLIKNTIFAAPNVVLKGLNEIIRFNV
ncbi:MAG: type III pantothenate kinase [Lentimicrobiaceae bacterium]|nr:type III pantothenate kinase [Lentimicrobiaceae bacterium]